MVYLAAYYRSLSIQELSLSLKPFAPLSHEDDPGRHHISTLMPHNMGHQRRDE